ncbi:MAG: hypothetical protein AB8G15_07320 [Saprospiraceae bacterium]
MKEIHKEWQKIWRTALGESIENMPAEIDHDFALICDIWQLEEEKLKACFSIFPKGELLFQRIQNAKAIVPKISTIENEKLLSYLTEINTTVTKVLKTYNKDKDALELDHKINQCTIKKVYRGKDALPRDLLQDADQLTTPLDDILVDLIKEKMGTLGEATYYFLTEPLYRFGGNTYEVGHWILWALLADEYPVDPYYAAYELSNHKAVARWNNQEMFVFIEV